MTIIQPLIQKVSRGAVFQSIILFFLRVPCIVWIFVFIISVYLLTTSCLFLNKLFHGSIFTVAEERVEIGVYKSVEEQFGVLRKQDSPVVSWPVNILQYIRERQYDKKYDFLGYKLSQAIPGFMTGLKYKLNAGFYHEFLPFSPFMSLADQSDEPMLVERSSRPFITPLPSKFTIVTQRQIDEQLLFFRRMAGQFPRVNFFVFGIFRDLLFSVYDLSEFGRDYTMPRELALTRFKSGLSRGVDFSFFEFNEAGFRDYFFRSDHHWTVQGGWAGYEQILRLIRKKVPSIGEAVLPSVLKHLDNIVYYGSYARQSAFSMVGDTLTYYEDRGYPDTVLYNGLFSLPRNDRMAVLSGIYKTDGALKNYYALMFGKDYGFLHYPGGQGSRNVLMFVDSYSNCMEHYFTSHYRNVYIVDLRYFEKDMGYAFNLEVFLRKYPVDDVLFMGNGSDFLFGSSEYSFDSILGTR
ncbi:MAG: hypothetical protein V2A70_10050 [Candidatus Omnitrophota bacterium]